ncbi:MAG: endo alpha-1,4 polygalactosaminidase [Bdellovibrionota bacterium]
MAFNKNKNILARFCVIFSMTLSTLGFSLRLHYQLGSKPTNYKNADFVVVDLFDTSASSVQAIQKAGKFVICYMSAGTAEKWRSDFKSFPKKVVGKKMVDWDGEYWLDIRSSEVMKVQKKRLDLAVKKGCDGVDPDNVDGYQNKTGFPLKSSHQVSYLKNLAKEARARGLEIGLKNATDLASGLVKDFDWIIIEECYKYKECSRYSAFPKAKKPSFIIEYTKFSQSKCNDAKKNGFDLMFANLALKGPFKYCN